MMQPSFRWISRAVAALALATTVAATAQTDAISRELTVLNTLDVPSANADAISRELTVVNELVVMVGSIDAISREVSASNQLNADAPSSDAISRELTARNQLLSEDVMSDAVTREATVMNHLTSIVPTSSVPATARPVSGTLAQQLATLNAAPPAFDPNTWLLVHRQNLNLDDEFLCGSVLDPLARGYVSADAYIDDFDVTADEVTFDNCGSAFYRFTFTMPDDAVLATASLTGSANVDDQGVVWLNSTRLSALMTAPSCSPANPSNPLDPCYLSQDAGKDRVDASGRRVLTWPTLDPFETYQGSAFVAGENTLIFAVAGDAQAFEPTGVEFAAAVLYFKRGDIDCSGQVDFFDIDPFVTALGGAGAYESAFPYCRWLTADMDCDADVDFFDIDPFVDCLSGNCSCP